MKNKKLLFYIAALLLFIPLNVLPANLSLLEVNRSFHLLKREITEIHLSNFLNPKNYSPEEEAVIVLTKKATLSELINLSFKDLPKEFIMNALLRSGTHLIKTSGSPLELLEKEFLARSVEQLTSWLLQNNLNIAGGEINLSYQNLERERVSEKFLYTVIRENENYISITIYSTKHIAPPLSVPGPAVSNSLWRMNEFKKEKLDPFSITFSGEIKETPQGAFYLKNNPEIEITFYEEPFDVSLPPSSFLEKLRNAADNFFGNIFSFFLSEENALKSSISSMFGKKEKEESISTTVTLEDVEKIKSDTVLEEKKEEKEEAPKTEETPPLVTKKESVAPSPIEINTAFGEDLEKLTGIGPTYAERIIENRPYCTLDDLLKVPGIGAVTLSKIKDQGLAYVSASSECFTKEEEKEDNREELIKALLEARETLESIRREVERRREEALPEEDDEEKEIILDVEINSASLERLTLIVGVGPSLAGRIIQNRPYCTLDDLLKVPGIGAVTLQGIKDQRLAYVAPPNSCNQKKDSSPSPSPSPSPPQEEESEEEEEEGPVEINSASSLELEKITGIGPSLAERIIENRPYCTLDDLLKVPGIGEVTLQKIKDQGLAYVEPDESCTEEEDDEDSNGGDEEEEEDKENDEEDEDEEENNIVVNNAEIYYHISLIQQIINSSGANNTVLDKSVVSRAEVLIDKILEKYFTTNLTKPSFIN
jgi:competence ComEA-like helix-hairpin-helix protein